MRKRQVLKSSKRTATDTNAEKSDEMGNGKWEMTGIERRQTKQERANEGKPEADTSQGPDKEGKTLDERRRGKRK